MDGEADDSELQAEEKDEDRERRATRDSDDVI